MQSLQQKFNYGCTNHQVFLHYFVHYNIDFTLLACKDPLHLKGVFICRVAWWQKKRASDRNSEDPGLNPGWISMSFCHLLQLWYTLYHVFFTAINQAMQTT